MSPPGIRADENLVITWVDESPFLGGRVVHLKADHLSEQHPRHKAIEQRGEQRGGEALCATRAHFAQCPHGREGAGWRLLCCGAFASEVVGRPPHREGKGLFGC